LEQKYPETIIDFLGYIKGRNPELNMKLNDVLKSHANGIARVMLQEVSEDPRIEDYVKTLEIMTAETLESEEKDYSDIERIAVGTGDLAIRFLKLELQEASLKFQITGEYYNQ